MTISPVDTFRTIVADWACDGSSVTDTQVQDAYRAVHTSQRGPIQSTIMGQLFDSGDFATAQKLNALLADLPTAAEKRVVRPLDDHEKSAIVRQAIRLVAAQYRCAAMDADDVDTLAGVDNVDDYVNATAEKIAGNVDKVNVGSRTRTAPNYSFGELVANGTVPVGAVLVAKNGEKATVNDDASLTVGDAIAPSLSAAATLAGGGKNVRGTTYWMHNGTPLASYMFDQ